MAREPRRRRRFGLAFLLLLSGAVSWQIIGNTAADTRAASDPEAALQWRSALPAALLSLAEQRLRAAKNKDDLAAASDFARQALQASPVDETPLRLLGLVADLQDQGDQAQILMTAAGNRSLRDTIAQVWLFDQAVRAGHLDEALAHADAVLRTRPELNDKLLPALAAAATDPVVRPTLVNLLNGDPPWRAWLLSALPQAADPSVLFAVLSDLQVGNIALRNSELQPYLNQLIDTGQFEIAYLAWLHFLPPSVGEVSYVYNGDFVSAPTGLAFDWIVSPIKGAEADTVASGDPEHGRALRVTFSDTRVPYSNVAKLMILPPGNYRLAGSERADNLNNERGMSWRIYCAEGDKHEIAASPLLNGTTAWQSFATTFVVPPEDCHAQWLKLELAARVALEQQVSGEVWYDDLTIQRQTLGAPLLGQDAEPTSIE